MALETRTQRNRLGYKAHTNKTQPASGGPEIISGRISGINLGRADDLPHYRLGAKVKLCLYLLVFIIILGSLISLIFPSRLGIANTLRLDWDIIIFTGLSIVAWISFLFSLLRFAACLSPKPAPLNMPHYKADIADNLPQYTILVPLFKEANMVKGLIEALSQITYPKDRLQILLICEIIDPQTIRQVQFHLKPPFSLIIVPKGTPQTKPRALNYALQFAKGNFITIYDAEDRPHKDQLLQAVSAFKANPDWAALQAPLDYFNANDNWLTRQFSLEYAALFHVWLPWLARMKLPFPLGGTSNHMRGLM